MIAESETKVKVDSEKVESHSHNIHAKVKVALRSLSGIFLLYVAWWFLVTPQTFYSTYNQDIGNFLAQLQHNLPSQEWNNVVQPSYVNTILLGQLTTDLAYFASQAVIFSLGSFMIGVGILHDVLTKTLAYQRVSVKVGRRSLYHWAVLPYVFLLADLSTSYISLRILSNFPPLESNPAVLALFEGNPLIYLANFLFGTVLLLPCLFGIFYAESQGLIGTRVRKLLVLILCTPFMIGIISNLAAIIIFR